MKSVDVPVRERLRARLRSGFSLVELFVVFAVMAVLLAVLLPAVGSARSNARSLDCRNKLRQVTLAVQNYTDAFAVGPDPRSLPFRLASQLDYRIDLEKFLDPQGRSRTDPVWVCPSEAFDETLGAFSYVPSNFVGWWRSHRPGCYRRVPVSSPQVLAADAVADGASNTVLMSELVLTERNRRHVEFDQNWRLVEPPIDASQLDRRRSVWSAPPSNFTVEVRSTDDLELATLSAHCESEPSEVYESEFGAEFGHQIRRNLRFGSLSGQHPGFNAVNTPNTASCVPESILGFEVGERRLSAPGYGSYAASSFHPGTVNAARFDGSVQSVSEDIDLTVWRALNSSDSGD